MIHHSYFRSSASWRVRIALNLKGLEATYVSHHLRKGEQRALSYLVKNPQGLLPTLELDTGEILTQSLAIMEWLEEAYPSPALLPKDPIERAKIRAFCYAIACEIHPVQNLKVLNNLRGFGIEEPLVQKWAADVNAQGLMACEKLLASFNGVFCFGDTPTFADICLVPQLANARRFGADISSLTKLLAVEKECLKLKAFIDAAAEKQIDAE